MSILIDTRWDQLLYVFYAEAVVRGERPDGYYFAEGLHQGDYPHPNARDEKNG